MDDCTHLVPQPKIWLRIVILALLLFMALISTTSWPAKLFFCLSVAAIFGTFPRPRINSKFFEKEWFVVFVPVSVRRTPLADVVQIETDLEQRFGMAGGCFLSLIFGVWNVLMVWLLDWLIPWAGGDYKLWLRTASGRRVLAWQGNGEANFRHNLDVLEDVSGLPVTRG